MSEKPWEMSKAKVQIEIDKWVKEDYPVRGIRLNRGRYEDIIPIVAHAAQAKLFDRFYDAVDPDDSTPDYVTICVQMPEWVAMCKAFGREPEVEG